MISKSHFTIEDEFSDLQICFQSCEVDPFSFQDLAIFLRFSCLSNREVIYKGFFGHSGPIHIPEQLNVLEMFPSHIQDLSSGNPLIVSGRYKGDFPDSIKVSGILADNPNAVMDLKVQNAKDIPLDRVFARQQIDVLTTQEWLSGKKELEEKVAKISLQTGFPSEFTCTVLFRADSEKKA